MKKIIQMGLAALVITLGTGCGGKVEEPQTFHGSYEGFKTRAYLDTMPCFRSITISEGLNRRVYAVDKDGDKRFDIINLVNVPKGHSLEQFGDIKTLEKVYDSTVEQEKQNKVCTEYHRQQKNISVAGDVEGEPK